MAYKSVPGVEGSLLTPDLATAPAAKSADGLTYSYTLRDGLKWDDGTPITSKDIKYGLERMWATDLITGGPYSYYLCLLDTCNKKQVAQYSGPYKDAKNQPTVNGKPSIDTPNDKTITFHLARQFADFDYLMSLPASAPVPQSRDTGAKYGLNPASSGPFKISQYSQTKSITFTRNPNWSQATDEVRHPLVDTVNLTFYSLGDDLDQRLKDGSVDFPTDGGVQSAMLAQIVTTPTLKQNADNPVASFTRYVVVFPSAKPLDNIECRKAVFYALNKDALRKIRGGPYGGQIATTMVTPSLPGADASYNPYPNGADYKGDLTAARQALTKCGHPNGFNVNLAYVSEGRGPAMFASAQASLGRVGIKVSGKPQAAQGFYSNYIGSPTNVKQQQIGLAFAAWGADFPSGYGFYNPIANGGAIQATGNSNYASLNDPHINAMLNKYETLSSVSARAALTDQIDKAVMAHAVYLPFQYDKSVFYRNARTTNIYLQAGLGSFYDIVNVGVSK